MKTLIKVLFAILVIGLIFAFFYSSEPEVYEVEEEVKIIVQEEAFISGYNTVIAQTDDTPCIASRNVNICGRDDVVACPRHIELDTKVIIDGKTYVCLDRTAKKYDNRYDISCDKDMECPYKVTGRKLVTIIE